MFPRCNAVAVSCTIFCDCEQRCGLRGKNGRNCCRDSKTKRAGKFPEYEFEMAPLAEDQQDKPGEVWRGVLLAETDRTAAGAGPVQ